MVSPVTSCACSQSTLSLVLPSAMGMQVACSGVPQALCSQSTRADLLKSGARTCCSHTQPQTKPGSTLGYRVSPDPSPASTHPLLTLDLPQLHTNILLVCPACVEFTNVNGGIYPPKPPGTTQISVPFLKLCGPTSIQKQPVSDCTLPEQAEETP